MRERYGISPERAIRDPAKFHRILSELLGPGAARFVESIIEEEASKRGITVRLRVPETEEIETAP